MSTAKLIIPAKVVWGYSEIPERGDNRDVRLGQAEIETGRSLASLRTRATRLVKADPAMQRFLVSYLAETDQIREYLTDTGVARVVEGELWEHGYYGGAIWHTWQAPTASVHHPELMITSRRKWIFKPKWFRTHGKHGGAGGITEGADGPAIQAYYACGYEGTLT